MGDPSYRFESARLSFRPLTAADCNAVYLGWLNDTEVNRYLETRHSKQSIEGIRAFVEGVNARANEHLFGMFRKDDGRHIGNIKVGPVNPHHPLADVSLLIGDRASWGQGFAAEAIRATSLFAFDTLRLQKLSAGMYDDNKSSYHSFLKAGWKHEGRLRLHALIEGAMQDRLQVGCIPADIEQGPV